MCFLTFSGRAQHRATTPLTDTLAKNDTLSSVETLAKAAGKNDSVAADTSKIKRLENELGIKISRDALPSIVKADANDSMVIDVAHNKFYLYGQAQVKYDDLQLNAGEIIYDQANNTVTAHPLSDTTGKKGDQPTFTQGKEKFSYDTVQYNFKSKRARAYTVTSQYGEGFVSSQQIKRNADQSIYGWHSVYTTCALDTPHYGIFAKKIKVVPGKVIATGPANIRIEGVPTPLFLPFGLFPISQKQRSGFVLPTYTIEQSRGLGLLNGGYYLYLSDHADLLTQANIYTKGSYAVSGYSNYSDLYHYSGRVNVQYAYNKTGEDFEPGASVQKDFILTWLHQSDPKAIPGQSFNASVQAGTSSFYSNNSYDPNQILQNQYQSNISFSKNWQGTPYSLTVSALHSQNTLTRQVNVTLPAVNFHINQINPFQNKHSIKTHWYDKITASYTFDELNKTTFYDSSFSFSNLSLGSFQSGIHQAVPISAAYTVLRFINMSFNVNYNEYWTTEKLLQQYNYTDAKVDSIDTHGFYASRDFNAGLNFSTRIYGLKTFKTGKLAGIRHVITPNVGFSYHPDFGASPFNYYYRTYLDSARNYVTLSPYQTSIVGTPPLGKAGAITYGLNNNLQIKVRTNKDTTGTGTKNVTLIDALSIGGSYNLAADSFRWSNIGINFRTNVLDKINISASSTFDPYAFDYENGRRLQQLMVEQGSGLARFTNAQLSLGSNFHSQPANGNKKDNPSNSEEYTRLMRNNGYGDYVDFNIPWSLNVSYSLTAQSIYAVLTSTHDNVITTNKKDTIALTQFVSFQGELKITERWKLNISSGYDFTTRQLSLTSIDIYRDLHCWEMHMQAIPFGPRKSYNFTLKVKATVLQDLKLIRRRDFRDAPQ